MAAKLCSESDKFLISFRYLSSSMCKDLERLTTKRQIRVASSP
jgi:hypothetical protein